MVFGELPPPLVPGCHSSCRLSLTSPAYSLFGIDSIYFLSGIATITLWQTLASIAHCELLNVVALLGFPFTPMNFVWVKTTQLVQILGILFNSGALYVKVHPLWPLSEYLAGSSRSEVPAGDPVAGYQDLPASPGNRVTAD